MVANPLQDITYVFRVEKADRQSHQFGNEVGNQGDANPGIHVQADPALNETDSHLSERQHQLGDEYQRDKIKIIVSDTLVNHRLGEERKNKRENTSQQHPYHQLETVATCTETGSAGRKKGFLFCCSWSSIRS